MKPLNTLLSLINSGASIVVNGHGVASTSLIALATAAAEKGVHLTICDISGTSINTLIAVATAGKGHVTFDFATACS